MAAREGWSDAVDWSEPTPLPPAAPPPLTPKPAKTRRAVEVVCCPRCEGLSVGRRDWRAGDRVATWVCRGCGASWKEPIEVGSDRRRAAIP